MAFDDFQTRIIRVEVEHSDHLATTTTAQFLATALGPKVRCAQVVNPQPVDSQAVVPASKLTL